MKISKKKSTLIKALKVLDCFTIEDHFLRLTDIAGKLKINKSTAHRILSDLVEEKFLEFDLETKRYKLGTKFLTYASIILSHLDIVQIAKPIMKNLVLKTKQTVNIAILDDCNVVYIAKEEPPASLRLSSSVGSRVPAYCTALGKVLLAYYNEEERKKIIDKLNLEKFTASTISSKNELQKELEKVKNSGFAIDHEEFLPGLMCVAFPIFNHENQVISSISIAGPVTAFKEKLLKTWEIYIKKAALQISNKLGYKKEKLLEDKT
jgi:IclR family transcriptional regulator, KDG regulon repressor